MTRISLSALSPEQRDEARRQLRGGATIVPVASVKGHKATKRESAATVRVCEGPASNDEWLAQAMPLKSDKKSVHTGTGRRGMSALEKRFAAYLEGLKLMGEVTSYAYELCRVTLPVKRSTKKPDFWIRCATWRPDGDLRGYDPIVVVEVKPTDKRGRPYFGPGAKMLVKLGAERLAEIGVPVFVAYEYEHEGGWRFERVETTS